ncbi:MAG: hypothetical protein JST68_10900 [Bacteroidetes bacterium]|nr:hypothetical protein [Bacteroidota bacterium]
MKNFSLTCLVLASLSLTARSQAHLNSSLPSNRTVCTGANATFTVSATGSGTLTYQWQESIDGGLSWNDLVEGSTTGVNPANGIYTGTTGPTLTITRAPSTMNGNKYQSIVSLNGGSPVTSIQATMNVGPDVSLDDATSTNCPGTSHTLNTAAAGGVSYQWQVNSGSGWGNVVDGADPSGISYAGGATGALTISSLAPAVDGYKYRYTANDGAGCIITSGVTTQLVPALAVFTLPTAGSITADPGMAVNIPVTISSGTGPFTYQWLTAVGAGTFSNIAASNPTYSGATSNTLTILSMTSGLYSNRYRVTIKNAGGCTSASSSFVQIGVMTTLPLGVESFRAQRQDGSSVRLSWSVGNGAGVRSYTVQRGTDGGVFVDAGSVMGETGRVDYSFVDEVHLGASALQYRIKMQGQDSSFVYSTVVNVNSVALINRAEIRPSLVEGGSARLYTMMEERAAVVVTVTDIMGRLQWSAPVMLEKGENWVPLDVSRLGKGLYFVKVGGGVKQTVSFVKE